MDQGQEIDARGASKAVRLEDNNQQQAIIISDYHSFSCVMCIKVVGCWVQYKVQCFVVICLAIGVRGGRFTRYLGLFLATVEIAAEE